MEDIGQRIMMADGAFPTGVVAIVQGAVGVLAWLGDAAIPGGDLTSLSLADAIAV